MLYDAYCMPHVVCDGSAHVGFVRFALHAACCIHASCSASSEGLRCMRLHMLHHVWYTLQSTTAICAALQRRPGRVRYSATDGRAALKRTALTRYAHKITRVRRVPVGGAVDSVHCSEHLGASVQAGERRKRRTRVFCVRMGQRVSQWQRARKAWAPPTAGPAIGPGPGPSWRLAARRGSCSAGPATPIAAVSFLHSSNMGRCEVPTSASAKVPRGASYPACAESAELGSACSACDSGRARPPGGARLR